MEEIIVDVRQGSLKGCQKNNLDGAKFYCFFGVPFAKPPLGELRFKAPLPCESWTGIRDATAEGDACFQRNLIEQVIEGSEDCLNLNIYTKSVLKESEQSYPVMVWFHGGAFTLGSNKTDVHGPEYLMMEDIVLVTVNYRVGVFGFLSLDDETLDIPGNAGLKDQAAALRWIQENIRSFNGNPENVTIFGASAGSASVHFHILSPTSKNLFHKAILQSGVALNSFAFSNTKVTELMEVIDVDVTDDRGALEVLRNLSVEELFDAQEKLIEKRGTMLNLFAPVIEKPNRTAFITRTPLEIIMSRDYNKVPMMLGYTSDEGLVVEFEKARSRMRGAPPTQDKPLNLEDLIPPEMGVPRGSETAGVITKMLQEAYFSGENASNPFLLIADALIIVGIYSAVKYHLNTSSTPIYMYKMTLDAQLNFLKRLAQLDAIPGACHGDEVGYLFRVPNMCLTEKDKGTIEDQAVRRFVKLWTNFAKYGNPTEDTQLINVDWRPMDLKKGYVLEIGEELVLKKNPEESRLNVWNKIYQLSTNTQNF